MTATVQNKPDTAGTAEALAQADHPLYLGDPLVVEGLLRPFFKLCSDDVGAYLGAQMTAEDMGKDIDQASATLGAVLLGQDKHYQTMGTWNTGGALPAFLRAQLGLAGTPDDQETVRLALGSFVMNVAEIHRLFTLDPSVDWQGMVDDLLASFTGLFIGVPLPSEAA